MAGETDTNKGGFGWPLGNTLGILATLGAALGISIPALVKANDAQDDDRRDRRGGRDIRDELAAQNTRIALLEQANVYKDQIAVLQQQNILQYVNGTFVKGQLLLPPTSIGQGLPPLPPPVFPPNAEVSSSTSSTSTSGNG